MENETQLPAVQMVDAIAMVLILDKDREKERIVIGSKWNVWAHLEGKENVPIMYDKERPLGQLFFDHDIQNREEWHAQLLAPLVNALRSSRGRADKEAEAADFLKEKMGTDNAVSSLVANKALSLYWQGKSCWRKNGYINRIETQILGLTRSFQWDIVDPEGENTVETVRERVRQITEHRMYRYETDVQLWYPWRKFGQECIVAENTLLPMIMFYLNRLDDWGFCFKKCDVCGAWFVAPNGHRSLCGDECRAIQKRRNEQAYDERARENRYDKDYQRGTQRIRRMLNKVKKRGAPEERCEELEAMYEAIREEGKKMKKEIKTEEAYRAFRDWLFAQERRMGQECAGA